jgi:hypothetical protein
MKYLKMLGLAAVAAMALTALVGVGSAAAAGTTLCKTAETPCKAENHYGIGTAISGESSNATLTSSLGNVVCSKSTVGGKTTTTGSNKTNVEGTIDSLTFTSCTLTTPPFLGGGTHSCTVSSINTPYKAVVADLGATKGSMTVTGTPGAKVDCGASVLRCQFTSSSVTLDVNSGNPATVVADKEPLIRTVYEGGICPSESAWDATYTVTAPKPLYIEPSA